MGVITMEANKLAEIFIKASPTVVDIRKIRIEPGQADYGYITSLYAFIIPVKGEAKFIFNDIPYHLNPGKVIHAGPNIKVNKRVVGDSIWEYYLIHYSLKNTALEDDFVEIPYELTIGRNIKVLEMLKSMNKAWRISDPISSLKVQSLFYNLLYEIFKSHHDQAKEEDRWIVEEAMNYIHAYYMEPITLKDLAKRYDLDKNRFSRLFNRYAGARPMNYLISYRMKRASELLLTSNFSVREVSENVGYTNVSYFTKLFKKYNGQLPSTYRRKFYETL
ncbi:transcriptional regulator, AraC family [Alkaliphilus oremlandii OhILAs]|uniref:Transcriptional regulator, AraC family n=2 Tax=Alkaliphilus oremlandii TaxID=461876 RepID=A8MKK7_ALKOO|nr:transcriptional regulator, AraC family [Alkaliphilus oremlandii OhILAs]